MHFVTFARQRIGEFLVDVKGEVIIIRTYSLTPMQVKT